MSGPAQHTQLVIKLLAITLAMFLFGFALVPLYDVFCDITGLNGKTSNQAAAKPLSTITDEQRQVRVQLLPLGELASQWRFRADTASVTLHPGAVMNTHFTVTNPTDKPVVVQAVPSVTPGQFAQYLHKIECFCFNQQPLGPNETKQMPLQFYLDSALPADVATLTLAYTLFDITERQPQAAEQGETYAFR